MKMIRTTCGHEVDSMDDVVDTALKGYTREDNRCIDFVALCKDCYTDYKTDGYILYNKKEQDLWLSYE